MSKDRGWLITIIILLIAVSVGIWLNHQASEVPVANGYMDIDDNDTEIDWGKYVTKEIELDESLVISNSGIYHLTGSIDNGSIMINAGVGEVKLILDNIIINNTDGPAIACQSADELVIELIGDNYITDGDNYLNIYDEDIKGALYSKSDLTFNGEGTLSIVANYEDGIVGKDDVKFDGGTYNIIAADDGIRGKDSVNIKNGNFKIEASGDGIKSDNETSTGKGFVLIENGNLSISSKEKAIKATNNILIKKGEYALEASDDAIHSDGHVDIKDGKFNISSKDDAIHANKILTIDGGNIVIAKSYEGLESEIITINGGSFDITSIDDGINAGGGNDQSIRNPRNMGEEGEENCSININGGNIYVNSSGDGIDSNGWLYINDGDITIDGSSYGDNGALDASMGIIMNGGKVIAVGASEMAETLGNTSPILNISIYFEETMPAKTNIQIVDEDGEELFNHTSIKKFDHIAAGTKDFELGKEYIIYIDDEVYKEFTVANTTTTIGTPNNGGFMPPNNHNRN